KLQHVEILVNHHAGWAEAREDHAVRFALQLGCGPRRDGLSGTRRTDLRLDARSAKVKFYRYARDCRLLCKELVFLIHQSEHVRIGADGFRISQQQIAGGIQCVMKHRKHPLLERGSQINQYVSATDQIQLRERRIAGHVLLGEDAEIADVLADLISAVGLDEETLEPPGGYVGRDVWRI